MKPKKPEGTRTIKYMQGTNPTRGFDGTALVSAPTNSIPRGTVHIRRSMWRPIPKCDYDVAKFAEGLARAEDRVLFFLDSSLFDTDTDQRVWDALLSRRHKLALIPDVRRELQPWIEKHPDHVAAKAVLSSAEAFVPQVGLDQTDDVTVAVAEYYVNLLAMRKNFFKILDNTFEYAHGRPPNTEEARRLRVDVNNDSALGPRAHLLAKKGEKDAGSPNFFTDEILVTLAALWGLEREREIVILTKDEDLQEQHYKLLYMMDTHYRGMLLAKRYKDDPQGFTAHEIPKGSALLAQAFHPCEGILIERTAHLAEQLLPARDVTISLHCWVAGRAGAL